MRSTRYLMGLLVAAFALGACDEDSVNGSGTGRLSVMLTDAPGDLAEAWVKIEQVILVRNAADTLSSDSTRRITITPDITNYINLLNLTGGQLLEIIDDESVPEGTYSQVRVVVDEAFIKLKDGRVFATSGAELPTGTTRSGTLRCPSCSSSGYKVMFTGGGLNVSDNTTVVLDFDAAQSFGHEAGNSGQWIMRPVLRASATTIRLGSIRGTVALAQGVSLPQCGGAASTVAQFIPTAVMGTDTLTGTTTSTGSFRISAVAPGTYTLGFARDLTFTNGDSLTITAAPSVPTVTVAQSDSATANYTISAASCH